jgi:hypothetical protein
MSLRTLLISELNALAKKGSVEELRDCLRRTMLDRPPTSLAPEEQDPADTAAFAWETTALRGRAAFEQVTEQTLLHLKVPAPDSSLDWPFVHAIVRLLAKLPSDKTSDQLKESTNAHLDGILLRRAAFLQATAPQYPQASFLLLDCLKLWLRWNPAQDATWIDPLFTASLQDKNWPLAEGAAIILLELASAAPKLITVPWLKQFWSAGRSRELGFELKELIFGIGNVLHLTEAGRERLKVLFRELKQESVPFIEDAAEMFLGDPERELLLNHNPAASGNSTFISFSGYRDPRPESINPSLLASFAA